MRSSGYSRYHRYYIFIAVFFSTSLAAFVSFSLNHRTNQVKKIVSKEAVPAWFNPEYDFIFQIFSFLIC